MPFRFTHFTLCLTALMAPIAAAAATTLQCTPHRACAATTCRDAAGMAMNFVLTYDAATANVVFDDPSLPVTETLEYRGHSEGAPAYFFRQPDLMVAVQIHEADTPPRVLVAFGDPDAPETANQLFATCEAEVSQ